MTILSVCQEVAPFIGLEVPSAVFSSTTREHIELKGVANDMADKIAKSYQWQKFATLETITGDDTTEDHDLPDDYDWMPDSNQLWTSDNKAPLSKIPSQNEWLGLLTQGYDPTPRIWIIYGDQIHIRSALATGITAKFFYQSDLIIAPASGSNKTAFTLDTDTFRLSERLLKLGIIYRWKQMKSQSHAEEMNDFEDLKERLIARDKGATILKQGTPRIPSGVSLAYPGNVPTS